MDARHATNATDKAPPESQDEATGRALVLASQAGGIDDSLAVSLTRAEIDVQISTAHAYPRFRRTGGIHEMIKGVKEIVTVDTPTATSCIYSLPRDGKAIIGASIRFAELLFQQWGNNRVASRIVAVNAAEGYVEAEAMYHDLETNSAGGSKVRRSIRGKGNKLYSPDMILVTGNAAASIAKRNAILGGIPRPVWNAPYDAALGVVRGDLKTLAGRRVDLLKAFFELGIRPEMVFAIAGIKGEADVMLDQFVVLSGMYQAIKNGEATVDDLLQRVRPAVGARSLDSAFGDPAAGKATGAATGPATPEGATTQAGQPEATGDKPAATAAVLNGDVIDGETGQVLSEDGGVSEVLVIDTTDKELDEAAAEVRSNDARRAAAQAEIDKAKNNDFPGDKPAPGAKAKAAPKPKDPPPQFSEVEEGCASPDELYHMADDVVGHDGMMRTYRNGELFSRAGPKAGHRMFAEHAPPFEETGVESGAAADEPALEDEKRRAEPTNTTADSIDTSSTDNQSATASTDNTGQPAGQEPQAETLNTEAAYDVDAFNGFAKQLRAADSWLQVKSFLQTFRRSPAYQEAPADLQRQARILAYNVTVPLIERGDPVSAATDPHFYALWLLVAERTAVKPMFTKLLVSKAFQALPDAAKEAITEETTTASGEL